MIGAAEVVQFGILLATGLTAWAAIATFRADARAQEPGLDLTLEPAATTGWISATLSVWNNADALMQVDRIVLIRPRGGAIAHSVSAQPEPRALRFGRELERSGTRRSRSLFPGRPERDYDADRAFIRFYVRPSPSGKAIDDLSRRTSVRIDVHVSFTSRIIRKRKYVVRRRLSDIAAHNSS